MSSADDAQLKHHVPEALAMRLQQLQKDSPDWHEWHQAGVLLHELAVSARQLRYPDWSADFVGLLQLANMFYQRALRLVTSSTDTLNRYAVMTDMALTRARTWCLPRPDHTISGVTGIINDVIRGIGELPESPERLHRLAIAYGFRMRVYWLAWLETKERKYADEAWSSAIYADVAFGHSGVTVDGGRAYASHLVAKALLYSQDRAHTTRASGLRREAGLQAFRLARGVGDRRQCVRALTVAALGERGERWLRRWRDKPHAIKAAIREAQTIAG